MTFCPNFWLLLRSKGLHTRETEAPSYPRGEEQQETTFQWDETEQNMPGFHSFLLLSRTKKASNYLSWGSCFTCIVVLSF